jgi:hypothetical protein
MEAHLDFPYCYSTEKIFLVALLLYANGLYVTSCTAGPQSQDNCDWC